MDIQNQPDLNTQTTESQQLSPTSNPSQRRWIRVFLPVSLIFAIALAILFFPIPYYQSTPVFCKVGATSCPTTRWNLGSSLWQQLFPSYTSGSPIEDNTPTQPSPTPTFDTNTKITINPETGWKIYRNKKYNFEMEYPPEWTYEDSSELALGEDSERRKSGYHILLGNPENTVSAGDGKKIIAGSVSMHIYNPENNAFYKENVDEYYPESDTRKTVAKNNLILHEIHHKTCRSNNDCISVIFKNKQNIFVFDTWAWTERYNDLNIIYQILSTFKFTDTGVMEAMTVEPCDLNEDGECNAADRTIFNKALGSKRGDLNYNPFADADADGTITIVDQQMLFPTTLPATPTPAQQKCAKYTYNGIATTVCATCGNGVCEPYETCTATNTRDGYPSLPECGPLFCGKDCSQ